MANPLTGLRLPQAAVEKLHHLAERTLRNQSDVVALLLLGASVSAHGGIRFTPPCAQASAPAAEDVP